MAQRAPARRRGASPEPEEELAGYAVDEASIDHALEEKFEPLEAGQATFPAVIGPAPGDEKVAFFQRFSREYMTQGYPVWPLLVLCITSAVRQLDADITSVLLPDMGRTFHLSLTGLTTITAVTLPVAFLLDPVVSYFG